MIKNIKTFSVISFIMFSMTCLCQNHDGMVKYTAQIDSTELFFHLKSDSTYEAKLLWGKSHGFYSIIPDSKNPFYDMIIFEDKIFGLKDIFYFNHNSMSQEVVELLVDSNLFNKDSFYVAMCDLTGEFITYYNVCFKDSTGKLLFVDFNEANNKACCIPMGTSSIGMIGEQSQMATYFKCDYNRKKGSIVFLIGPSLTGFYIKKDRSSIMYRPCHCEENNSDCCVIYKRYF